MFRRKRSDDGFPPGFPGGSPPAFEPSSAQPEPRTQGPFGADQTPPPLGAPHIDSSWDYENHDPLAQHTPPGGRSGVVFTGIVMALVVVGLVGFGLFASRSLVDDKLTPTTGPPQFDLLGEDLEAVVEEVMMAAGADAKYLEIAISATWVDTSFVNDTIGPGRHSVRWWESFGGLQKVKSSVGPVIGAAVSADDVRTMLALVPTAVPQALSIVGGSEAQVQQVIIGAPSTADTGRLAVTVKLPDQSVEQIEFAPSGELIGEFAGR